MNDETSTLSYLNEDDWSDFEANWGTENEDLLVAGSRTQNRLERYLSEENNFALRVIFTAVVRDFKLPPVRYSFVVALTVFALQIEQKIEVKESVKNIVETELGLVLKHLMEEELESYNKSVELVLKRWNEYLDNPTEFVV